MKRALTSVALLALVCAGFAAAAPAVTADWSDNASNGQNYLEVHEHFFTNYVRLSGKWTIFLPSYCAGDYGLEAECMDAVSPDVSIHIYRAGREVYSDELYAFGTEQAGGRYVDGKFTERLYVWEYTTGPCYRSAGNYSWRIQMDDPLDRPFQVNVRHTNGIRVFCKQ